MPGLSAICYAEVASAIPVSGSTYSYAYHAMGEFVAMIVAACVLLEYGVSSAAVAVGWSGYFNELLENLFGWHLPDALSYSPVPYEDNTTGIINLPAVVLVMMCMVLLIRGASESARVNTVMVLIKLGVLMLFVVIGFTAFNTDHFGGLLGRRAAGHQRSGGDRSSSPSSGSMRSRRRVRRCEIHNGRCRARSWARWSIVVSVYVLVAVAGVGAQPVEEFENPDQQSAGLSVILENITGSSVPATILAAGAVISIFSVTLVTLYGQTRILFAMGRDGMLPDKFASVNPRTLTPTFNTIVVSIVVALIGGFVPADYLWDTVSIGTLMAFIVVALAVLLLRRTEPDLRAALPRPAATP